jgi:hypothetical protein
MHSKRSTELFRRVPTKLYSGLTFFAYAAICGSNVKRADGFSRVRLSGSNRFGPAK